MTSHTSLGAGEKAKRFFFILAFILSFSMSGCASAELKTLDTLMATIQPTTGREVEQWRQDKGIALGKPVYAQVSVDYEPLESYSKTDLYNELIITLEKNSWQKDEVYTSPDYYRATLHEDRFKIVATVLNHSGTNIVSIYLEIH